MNILVVNYEYPPIGGGGGSVTRDLAERWVAAGHRVTVVTSRYAGLSSFDVVNGVHVERVPVVFRGNVQVASNASMLSYVPSSSWHVMTKRGGDRFDVINTHFAVPSGPSGWFLSRALKVPNVLSIHGGDIFDPSKSLSPHRTPLVRQVVRTMMRRADRVVAQSTDTRDNAVRYYAPECPVDIIPLGIPSPVFARATREHLGLPAEAFVLSTVGRLVRRKNLDDALLSLRSLRGEVPALLVVIGDGPERARLERMAQDLGVCEMVCFAGSVDDERKFQLLTASDLYVSTASHEGFGLAFLEAMACGTPVACYDHGGQTDFLVDAGSGYLVPLGDVNVLGERIRTLFRDPKLRGKMGDFARQLANDYSIDRCADRYLALFREVRDGNSKFA